MGNYNLTVLWWLLHNFFQRAASTSSQDGECKSEPTEKKPRKNSDNGDNDGDVEMVNKEAVKTVTIKKRKEAGFLFLRLPLYCFSNY